MKRSVISSKKNFSQKGFYIIMLICILTVAAAIYVVSKSEDEIYKLNNTDENLVTGVLMEETQENTQPEADDIIPVISEPAEEETKPEETTKEETETEPEPEPVEVSTPATKTLLYVKPVNGEVLCGFSLTELVYSNTMGDWRTHAGVDLKGSVGTQVKAMSDGVVEDIYNDELYGQVIVIDHGDNLKSLYANLSESVVVKKGQEVSAGDVIGGIGETAMIEMADPPHLHLEVLKDGTQVDPFNYIR